MRARMGSPMRQITVISHRLAAAGFPPQLFNSALNVSLACDIHAYLVEGNCCHFIIKCTVLVTRKEKAARYLVGVGAFLIAF